MSTEIPDTDWMELPIDSHGTHILDIDRDGLLDIYIATGGGMGLESGPAMNAAVLWGEPSAASVNVWSWVVVPTRAVGQISSFWWRLTVGGHGVLYITLAFF